MSNVSDLPSDFVKLMDALAKKYDESQQFIQNSLIGIGEKIQSLEKGEWVDKSYSTKTLNPSSSAAPTSTSQSLYSMPSNYFAGQSPPPCSDLTGMAEPIRLVQWWPAQQHQHHLCQLFLRLVLAEQMNW